MIGETLFESSNCSNTRLRWTTLLSLFLQTIAVATAFVLSLGHIDALPRPSIFNRPLPLPRKAITPVCRVHQNLAHDYQTLDQSTRAFVEPRFVPHGIGDEQNGPPAMPDRVTSLGSGPLDLFLRTSPAAVPHLVAPPSVRPVRVSHLDEGQLIKQIKPVYPELAKIAGVQGRVVLSAVISRDGGIETLQLLSGHPLLARAALDAVRQWRYRPYLLNAQAVEVETQITVNFILNSGQN